MARLLHLKNNGSKNSWPEIKCFQVQIVVVIIVERTENPMGQVSCHPRDLETVLLSHLSAYHYPKDPPPLLTLPTLTNGRYITLTEQRRPLYNLSIFSNTPWRKEEGVSGIRCQKIVTKNFCSHKLFMSLWLIQPHLLDEHSSTES